MNRDTIIYILNRLSYPDANDFDTEKTSLIFEFREKKYEVEFERRRGEFLNFQVTYVEEVKDERPKE